MLGALRCMYFLTKFEIPHKTNFGPLCELGKALGTQYLQDIQCGDANAQYMFKRFKQELVQALAEAVAKPILRNICSSPFFARCG